MVGLVYSVNSYLLGVTQEVTAKSEATGFTSNSKDKSTALAVEPSNPLQLSLLKQAIKTIKAQGCQTLSIL